MAGGAAPGLGEVPGLRSALGTEIDGGVAPSDSMRGFAVAALVDQDWRVAHDCEVFEEV